MEFKVSNKQHHYFYGEKPSFLKTVVYKTDGNMNFYVNIYLSIFGRALVFLMFPFLYIIGVLKYGLSETNGDVKDLWLQILGKKPIDSYHEVFRLKHKTIIDYLLRIRK